MDTPASNELLNQDTSHYSVSMIVNWIKQFYFDPSQASRLSEALTEFQTSSVAWDISIVLLTECVPHTSLSPFLYSLSSSFPKNQFTFPMDDALKSVVSFFAAQTVCTLCQSGYKGGNQATYIFATQQFPAESNLAVVQRIIKELLACYCTFSPITSPTVRQLTQASGACFLFSLLESIVSNSAHIPTRLSETAISGLVLSEFINSYTASPLFFPAFLDILTLLPTDLCQNRKLALTTDQRQNITSSLLQHIADVFGTLTKIHFTVIHSNQNGNSEASVYLTVSKRWLQVDSSEFHSTLSLAHITDCLRDIEWYKQLFQCLPCVEMTNETEQLRSTRLLILQCFFSWIEVSTRYRQRHSDAQSSLRQRDSSASLCDGMTEPYDVMLGSTLYDARLLLQTPLLHIVLMNFVFTVHSSLHEAFLEPFQFTAEDLRAPMVFAESDDIASESELNSQLLRTSADTITELIELMFTMYSSHSPDTLSLTNEKSQTLSERPLLSLLNWTNFQPLIFIFYSVSHVNNLIRSYCTESAASPHTLCAHKIARLPHNFLRVFITLVGKFAEVFLPALIYSVQNNTVNAVDFQFPPSIPSSLIISIFTLPDHHAEQRDLLENAHSIFNSMLDFLQHPSLEIRHLVLDVWFSLVGNQFIVQQAQLDVSQKELGYMSAELISQRNSSKLHESFILSSFDALVDRVIELARYPSNLKDVQDSFPFTAFIKFRDDCSMTLTDATTVLCYMTMLDKAGEMLVQYLKKIKEDTSFAVCCQVEVCLFVLTAIAPRAQAGVDTSIPLALNSLTQLPYHQSSYVETYVMIIAAARLTLWTTGFIGAKRELFATSFQLLKSFLPSLLASYTKPTAMQQQAYVVKTEFQSFRNYTERVLIEAMSSIATAASSTLTMDVTVPESDITFVLNGLAESVLLSQLTMESRCSLIIAAGVFIQCLSVSRMQKYHYQLAKALEAQVFAEMAPGPTPTLTPKSVEYLKLFFTALESVEPVETIPIPPFSYNAVPLDPSSEFRHPVLNVIEEFWSLFEQCLLEFRSSEILIEAAFHCIIRIFSKFPNHAVRYMLFLRFLKCLSDSFLTSPTIFHLNALRSMIGVFGGNREEPVIRGLVECLLTCTLCVLDAIKVARVENFVSQSPDIVGMAWDCINTALSFPFLVCEILDAPAFCDVLLLCIAVIPECRHSKVLMTMLLLVTRFTVWLDPIQLMETPSCALFLKGAHSLKSNPADATLLKCSKKAMSSAERLGLVEKIVVSITRVVTEVFHGNTQWIGIVATLLVQLRHINQYATLMRETIRLTLQSGQYYQAPDAVINEFCDALNAPETVQTHPFLCRALQQLANNAEIQWQQKKYCHTN